VGLEGRTAFPLHAETAEGLGRVAERPGLARNVVFLSTVSTKTSAPRDRYPSGRGARVSFNPSPPSGLAPLRDRTQPLELQATIVPGPGTNLRTGGDFGKSPMDGFTSPILSTRSITPDSRPGRRPSALPVLSGEIEYAGGFGAEESALRENYRGLISLGSISRTHSVDRRLSPRSSTLSQRERDRSVRRTPSPPRRSHPYISRRDDRRTVEVPQGPVCDRPRRGGPEGRP
jgi:hypothetical protein